MDDSYLSISFKVHPISGIEILIAELSLLEFELFEEKPYGLIAYIKSSEYSQTILEKVIKFLIALLRITKLLSKALIN
mgnify:CR=1 FL=1